MIGNARETLILADSSKFGTRSLQQITDLNSNLSIFTDSKPELQLLNAIEENGTKIFICEQLDTLNKDSYNE
jgi:DeoR/GlpR family transcriptional regulator of sugar metabolism